MFRLKYLGKGEQILPVRLSVLALCLSCPEAAEDRWDSGRGSFRDPQSLRPRAGRDLPKRTR